MNVIKFHVVDLGDNHPTLYCDSKLTLLSVDKQTMKKIKDGNDNNSIFLEDNNVSTTIESLPSIKHIRNDISDLRNVDRITLCVSNDCNLRCRYCYADGGNYGVERGLMSLQTAEKFISFCNDNFDTIRRIVFFGGEPMLNLEVIEYVCSKIKKVFISKSKDCPQFGIITNGTIFSPDAFTLIKKYISSVTVSIDGPQKLHDQNRMYANGNGCYNKVIEFVKKIKNIPNLQIMYEATFTQNSIDDGYNILSLKTFLNKTLGIKGVIINDSHLDKRIELDNLCSITEEDMIKSNFECLPVSFWKILQQLVNRENNTFCNIGYKNFSVSTKGQIYTCHLVNEKKMCNMGSIESKNLFNDTPNFQNRICSLNKETPECEMCWCRNLCGGCTIEYFLNKERDSLTNHPNQEICNFFKLYIEYVLALITKIRKNRSLWQQLLYSLNKEYI